MNNSLFSLRVNMNCFHGVAHSVQVILRNAPKKQDNDRDMESLYKRLLQGWLSELKDAM